MNEISFLMVMVYHEKNEVGIKCARDLLSVSDEFQCYTRFTELLEEKVKSQPSRGAVISVETENNFTKLIYKSNKP